MPLRLRRELKKLEEKKRRNKERIERLKKLPEEKLPTNTLWINKKESMRNSREEREIKREDKENSPNKRRTNILMNSPLTKLLIREP